MKFQFGGLLAVALIATAGVAWADSAEVNQNGASDQQAGIAGGDATLKNDMNAKKVVGPQSVMLQTALMNTKAQIEGLKSEFALSETGKPDARFLNQVKTYDRNMDNAIRDATSHESRLKSTLLKSYPQIASTDGTKNLDFSVSDLESFYKSWSSKAKDRSYWMDKDQAKADLDSLDKRIDKAIDQSKNFNSDQFDISVG